MGPWSERSAIDSEDRDDVHATPIGTVKNKAVKKTRNKAEKEEGGEGAGDKMAALTEQ